MGCTNGTPGTSTGSSSSTSSSSTSTMKTSTTSTSSAPVSQQTYCQNPTTKSLYWGVQDVNNPDPAGPACGPYPGGQPGYFCPDGYFCTQSQTCVRNS